ncbi:Hca operon transcriptional activator [Roseovarius albus]|uniref:Hca operon transcriptional activator n=1 Tax=Roseovarius albus TaxID=1247867 RepID=A0A1X6ZWM0_9RHOB|nr:LysR family transcriptional regulator [Roseovarius albus]SLN63648.1 Hca operon transcriptional activator [Roseovarius albus]
MNIVAIETFLTVTRVRNLNRAAEEMNITQSAVTARLYALEQALGTKLLNRSRKGATLTKAGYAFLEQAELITSTWANAKAQANLPSGVTQLFSFVCAPALWPNLGQDWIDGLRRDHPETAVEVWAGLKSDAQSWLQSGMSDAALLPEPITGPGFDHRVFSTETLIQVSTVEREAVRWDPHYIFVDYGPAFRAQHAAAWPSGETASLSVSNPDWAREHLFKYGGSAYLPERIVQEDLAAGRLFAVRGSASFTQRSVLSWRKASEPAFAWLGSS